MLKGKFRLKKRKDFENTYKKGKTISNNFFLIKITYNNLEFNRIGFVVSKKTANKIVTRNKIKRKIREIIRLMQDELKNGYDVIVIAKSGCLNQKYKDLKINLEKILKKGNLLINEKNISKIN